MTNIPTPWLDNRNIAFATWHLKSEGVDLPALDVRRELANTKKICDESLCTVTGNNTFARDTFTDTDGVLLENHTGEFGASWTVHPAGAAGSLEIGNNHLEHPNINDGIYLASGVPTNADYWVQAEFTVTSSEAGNVLPGIVARSDSTADTSYFLRYNLDSSRFEMKKRVLGVQTDIGTNFTDPLSISDSRIMRLEVEGTSIRGFIDDVLRIQVTDADITAAGSAGLRWVGVAGWHMDSFVAENLTA